MIDSKGHYLGLERQEDGFLVHRSIFRVQPWDSIYGQSETSQG